MFLSKKEKDGIAWSNILLLVFTFILIFLVPLFLEANRKSINSILFSAIFFLAIFTLGKTIKKQMIFLAIIAFITEWIAEIFELDTLYYISSIVNVLFFVIIVIRLIIQIAKSKEVNVGVILESVNAYLLLGLMFTMLVAILHLYNADALGFSNNEGTKVHDFIYFTFVTMSTLGYGDIIPHEPIGKSLSILISVTGQLYIAIIVAMLVGKFSAGNTSEK
jgi:glucan phosphoethanolaminetransferase (alkaline phosphatase superfamily)